MCSFTFLYAVFFPPHTYKYQKKVADMVLYYLSGDSIHYRKKYTKRRWRHPFVTLVNGSRPTHTDAQYQNEVFPELDHYHPRLLSLLQGNGSTIYCIKESIAVWRVCPIFDVWLSSFSQIVLFLYRVYIKFF